MNTSSSSDILCLGEHSHSSSNSKETSPLHDSNNNNTKRQRGRKRKSVVDKENLAPASAASPSYSPASPSFSSPSLIQAKRVKPNKQEQQVSF